MSSFATSYIPTQASQVTRAADVAVITAANFSRWYNQSEGTFVCEATTTGDVVTSWAMAAQNAGSTSMIGFDIDVLGSYRLRVTNSGANQALVNAVGTIAADTIYRIAGAYKTNDFAVSANGGIASTDTSGSVPADLIALAVGSSGFSGGSSWNGHIRRIRFYPTRLSNTQLQALTA